MITVVFFTVTLFFALSCSKPFSFTLVYRGPCQGNNGFSCQLKAASQVLSTQIYPNGTVDEAILRRIGALSVAVISKPTPTALTFQGNVSFGIHLTHTDHYLEYRGNVTEDVFEQGRSLACWSASGVITNGVGSWKGATGTIGISGCTDVTKPSSPVLEATVAARIFVPS